MSARDALNRHSSQISDALKNAISASLGGQYNPDEIILDPENTRKIEQKIAEQGENKLNEIMAQQKLAMAAAKAQNRAAALKNFGAPTKPTGTSFGSTKPTNNNEDAGAKVPTDFAKAEASGAARTPSDNTPAQTLPTPEDEEKVPSRKSPTSEDPIEETTEDGTTKRKYQNGTESWNAGKNQDQNDGLQYCPVDGEILNPDGTCPAGDHGNLGAQPNQSQPKNNAGQPVNVGNNPNPRVGNQSGYKNAPNNGGARSFGRSPARAPQALAINAAVNDEGQQKIAEIDTKIQDIKDKLAKVKKQITKNETTALWARAITGCSCFTIILPIFGALYLFNNHQKKSKLEKKSKALAQDLTKLTKERGEVAKQYNLKS